MGSRLISRDSGRPTSHPFWVHSRQHPPNIHSLLSCPYHIQRRVRPSHSEGRDSPRTGFLSSSKLIDGLFPLTLCMGLISSLCLMYPKSIPFLCSFSLSINPIPSFKEAFFWPIACPSVGSTLQCPDEKHCFGFYPTYNLQFFMGQS